MKRLFTPVAFLVASALLLCSFGGCTDGAQGATDQIRYPTQTHVPTDSPIDNKAIESELNLTHSVAETSYLSFEHSAMVGKTIDNIFGYEVDLVYNRTFIRKTFAPSRTHLSTRPLKAPTTTARSYISMPKRASRYRLRFAQTSPFRTDRATALMLIASSLPISCANTFPKSSSTNFR